MKKLLLALPCLVIGLFIFMGQNTSDNQKTQKWNIDPRMTGIYDPSIPRSAPLPMEYDYFAPNTQTYFYSTPNGVMAVNPSFRVLPRIGGTTATNSWQSEVIITRHPLNPLIMYGSSNAVTNPAGSLFISEGAYVTTNGGTTWFGSDTMKNTSNTILTGHGGDPGITIDKNGRFIISHLGGGIKANFSTNNGLNWSNDVTITTGSQDKNLSGTDDSPTSPFYGRSYTVWSRFTASLPPIAISYTTNGGTSWSAPADINSNITGHYSQGCDIRTGPNGEVYVCWTQPISGGSFTGDSIGFAKSTNGGVSWVINTNRAYNMNGIRGNLLSTNIRVNDFPRMDVDRTCGPRAGWIYIVTPEKNLSPAGTDADIVLHRSTNGGTSWSAGVRVNQDALNNGKSQWFPVVRVDESGAVNVVYNDNRSGASTDSVDLYLSRSLDGGVTFTDTRISDHRFRPAPITGLAAGYSGDYIGLTSALVAGNPVNGNQRLFPLWMDNSVSGIFQAFSAKVELQPVNPCAGCEDFSNTAFTPNYFHLEFTGTQNWSQQSVSAYGIGTGSAKYDFFNDNVFASQSLVTSFSPVGAGYYLTFDEAYAPYGSGFGPDSLIVESSTNMGASYSTLAVLQGIYPSGGELNTAPATTSAFIPANNQWASKIYALPAGTNRVRLRAESGFGNNLYIDNVCIQSLPAPVSSSLCAMSEGYFIPSPIGVIPDTIRAYLHRADLPNIIVDSTSSLSTNYGCFFPTFNKALSGSYYLVFKQRNSIEAWTNTGVINYTRGSAISLDIINNNAAVFGNNQKLVDVPNDFWAMFSGEIEQDDVIDAADITLIYNDMLLLTSGYVLTDVNGDSFVDVSDLVMTYNNALLVVQVMAPPGAEPTPSNENDGIPEFKTDFERQKYELLKQQSGASETKINSNKAIIESHKDVYEMMKKIIEERSKNFQNRPQFMGDIANPNSALGLPACK